MNTKKTAKILSLVAVLALVLTAVIAFGITASAETTGKEIEVSNASDLTTLLSGEALADGTTLADGDTIVLTADIYMGTAGTCATAKKVTITSKDSICTIYRGAEGQTALTMSASVPMFTLSAGAEVTLTNVILDGQKSVITDSKTNGSGFDVTGGAVLVFGDGVVGQNFSAARGAVVYVTDGSFTLTGNAKLTANKAGTGGGAAYLKAGSMTLEDTSEISNNTSANGGAVFMLAGTFTMKDSAAVKDNTASQHGGALQMSGTVNIHGGTISGNDVTTSKKQGGGIYMNSGTFTMTDGVITGNTTAGSGGGIYFNQGTHTISGGYIQSNTATVNGGGIGISTATGTVSGTTIGGEGLGNTATANGGGIVLASSTGKLILNKDTVIADNSAVLGGGVYSAGTFVINNGVSITSNLATGAKTRGGGVAVYGGSTYMMGGSISNNTNSTTYGGGVAISGGTFYMYGGEVANNTITAGSSSTAHGAGINVSVKGSAYLVGGTIKGNVSTAGNGRAVSIYGSVPTVNFGAPAGVELPAEAIQPTGEALFLYENDNNQLSFAGDDTNGTASIAQVHLLGALPAGSQVLMNGTPAVSMETANAITFANTIFDADGAVLLVNVTESTREAVFGRIVTSVGGVMYTDLAAAVSAASGNALTLEFVKGGADLVAGEYTIDGAGKTFSNTVANTPMITLPEGATVTFTNITLDGAGVTSTGHGGAFYVNAGAALTLGEGVVISNFTALNGGGVFIDTDGELTVKGGATIKDNTATSPSYGGGGIYAKGELTLEACTISGNIAYKEGAGIYGAAASTVYIKDGALITLNLGYGSNVYGGGVRSLGTLIMTGGEISHNATTAPTAGVDTRGAGVYSTGTFWLTGGKITENVTVGQYGGGVFIGGYFYMLGGEITDNRIAKLATPTEKTPYGVGINFSTDAVEAYFLGGTISGNKYVNRVAPNVACEVEGRPVIEVKDNGEMVITTYSDGKKYSQTVYDGVRKVHPEIMIYASSKGTKVHLGGSIPVANAPVENGVNNVINNDTTVTTTNALCIPTAPNGAATIGYRSGYSTPAQLILNGNLNAGSQVVLSDNFSDTDNYFMTVAEGVVLDKTTLGAIQLNGADAAYNAEIVDGKLVWPTHQYLIVGRSAGLRDDILLRLYVVKRDSDNATAPVIEFAGKTIEWQNAKVDEAYAANIPQAGNYIGTYYIEVPMSPKQITEAITVTYGEDDVQTRTFAGYLDDAQALAAESSASALETLIVATRNYCTAAQGYFNYKTDDLANENYQSEIADITAASGMALNQFADTTLPRFQSARVVLEDKVSVKIFIKQWVENFQYSVTLGGETYTPTTAYDEVNGLYMIVIENISACDLENRIVVTMTDGVNTATLDYSALDYAINKQGDTEGGLDYVAKALYAYANAAAAYVAAN